VVTGYDFSCALSRTGTVNCWGDGFYLGDGKGVTRGTAAPVVGIGDAVQLSAGAYAHTCALRASGRVSCWGQNGNHQLGNGTTSASNTPVDAAVSGIVALANGIVHSCAVSANGGVQCWGAFQQNSGSNIVEYATPTVLSGINDA